MGILAEAGVDGLNLGDKPLIDYKAKA